MMLEIHGWQFLLIVVKELTTQKDNVFLGLLLDLVATQVPMEL
jgi:hypothetical protein